MYHIYRVIYNYRLENFALQTIAASHQIIRPCQSDRNRNIAPPVGIIVQSDPGSRQRKYRGRH